MKEVNYFLNYKIDDEILKYLDPKYDRSTSKFIEYFKLVEAMKTYIE